jgi:hypothetical protein
MRQQVQLEFDSLDEAASLLMQDALEKHGISCQLVTSEQASAAQIASLEPVQTRLVCISYLDTANYKNARYLVRRMRKRVPDIAVVIAFWGAASDDTRYLDALEASEADVVTTGLQETIECVLQFSRTEKAEGVKATQ